MLGLVRSSDGQFDFQDLVSLRTIAELVTGGVRPETIARSLHGLASVAPDAARPLAQLRIVQGHGGALLAELGGALIDPRGQMLLRFDAPESHQPQPAERPLLTLRAGERDWPDTAEGWLQRGAELESQDRFDEAAAAYRAALALRDPFPEAHFNLGNVHREAGRASDASAAYRKAVEQDFSLAQAWYNLADLEEEAGRLGAAAEALRSALASSPGFADAHFNLAHVYERLGRRRDAARHWSEYLRVDHDGPWADQARVRLAACRAG
jgi:tetratricopeptide (TPR) repeat protein